MFKRSKLVSLFSVATLALAAPVAFAAGPDVSDLTGAVDMGTVVVGILAVFAVMATAVVAMKAGQYILGSIRKG